MTDYLQVDALTGAVSRRILKEVDPTTKPSYDWPDGRFGFVGMVYISKLARMKLPADALRLALLMMEHAEFNDGISIKPFKDYAGLLDVSRSRVSEYLNLLEANDIVARLGGRFVMMNPQLFWHGNSTEQRNAVKRWAAIHQPVIVFDRKLAG